MQFLAPNTHRRLDVIDVGETGWGGVAGGVGDAGDEGGAQVGAQVGGDAGAEEGGQADEGGQAGGQRAGVEAETASAALRHQPTAGRGREGHQRADADGRPTDAALDGQRPEGQRRTFGQAQTQQRHAHHLPTNKMAFTFSASIDRDCKVLFRFIWFWWCAGWVFPSNTIDKEETFQPINSLHQLQRTT